MTILKTAGRRYKHELETDVFTAAQARMQYLYENFDVVVISWSGGKDSSTCLELARNVAREQGKLPVKVLFLDEEVIYPETLDLAYRHKADPEIEFYWVCVPSIYRNACSEVEPDFIPFDPLKRALWTHEPPLDAIWPAGFDENGLPNMTTWRVPPSIPKLCIIKMFGDKDKKVIEVTGLRAEESKVRELGLFSSGSFITTRNEKGMLSARPIYDWKVPDVWLAIKENGWDYNKAYDKLWRAGGSPRTCRVAPLFHAEAAMELRKVMLFWPDFWQLVKRRIRGAHAVAIYNGELHKVERLSDETWQQAAERYLNSLGSEQDKKELYNYINIRFINKHNNRSANRPLPDEERCSCCGLSWKIVARAIARGDRQQRMLIQFASWR